MAVSDKTFGVITSIQKMCMNDGPGYRTTVFLKGCSLNCQWCHNPEGKRRFPEVIPYVGNCTGCGECIQVCPTGALRLEDGTTPRLDTGLCTTCLQCVKVCRYDGVVVWGKIVSVAYVMEEVLKDKPFYIHSGGGLTLSGGEPMVQPGFSLALLKAAKEEGIGTALDTCGHAAWEEFERVLEYTDMVLFDAKIRDSLEHRQYAGIGNEQILENARRIASLGIKMRIRIPVIPGRNDSMENWIETAKFIESLGDVVQGVDLLPYHPYAGGKYLAFGMEYPFPMGEGLNDDVLVPVIDFFVDHAPEVTVGG